MHFNGLRLGNEKVSVDLMISLVSKICQYLNIVWDFGRHRCCLDIPDDLMWSRKRMSFQVRHMLRDHILLGLGSLVDMRQLRDRSATMRSSMNRQVDCALSAVGMMRD